MESSNGSRVGKVLSERVVLRATLYYALLFAAAWALWRVAPDLVPKASPILGNARGGFRSAAESGPATFPGAATVALAMIASVLFALPVAWVYTLTRAKRGFQQSVVQTLVILPTVVAGVVVLVKDSLALAFGLAGIVAAVRFRTALDDSKDAVYVFLVTGVGLAAAVDLPVAAAISLVFNALVLCLWYTDFGRTPAHLDGRIAERKMQRALEQLSRTGTFVARLDSEVMQDMSSEQLQALADRAWRRARRHNPELPDADGRREALLRVRTDDVESARRIVEPLLDEYLKRWRYGGVVHEAAGTHVVEYVVLLRKGGSPDEVLDGIKAATAGQVVTAEFS